VTEKEKIVVDDVEHTIEDLTQEQKYMIAQIRDLQNKVSQARFVLDQTQAALNVFTNSLSQTFKKEEEKKDGS
jgi:nicotinamide mononucleotide adenylyltransferase